MSCRAGFVWETSQHFCRYLTDCGISCDVITPHLLAAPFFRGTFNCLIIPTGFANPKYSRVLPALRASASRIERFVENGGNLLVFGAAIDKADAYDWLPFPLNYRHDYRQRSVAYEQGSPAGMILADYDAGCIECDGIFTGGEECGPAAISCTDGTVLIDRQVGAGRVIVTSIHEYPSRAFIAAFCAAGTQTLF